MITRKKRVLVLGGFGFLGSSLSRSFLAADYQVRIFGRNNSKSILLQDILRLVEVVEGDIGNDKDILKAMKNVDTVIHAVHTTVPGSSMKDPEYDVMTNVALPLSWMSRLGETCINKIIYISSGGTVYGMPESDKITELHPTNPVCSYGITKLMNEKYLSMYTEMFDIKCIIVRPSNIYGKGQRLDKGQGVIGTMLNNAMGGKTLEILGTGETLRDYIYIDDVIPVFLKLLVYGGKYSVFNLSSGIGHSVLDIVSFLQSHLGRSLKIKHLPGNKHDVPVNVLNSSRLMSAIDWAPDISIFDGIKKLINDSQNL